MPSGVIVFRVELEIEGIVGIERDVDIIFELGQFSHFIGDKEGSNDDSMAIMNRPG